MKKSTKKSKPPKHEFETTLVLSTGHITTHDDDLLKIADQELLVVSYTYGYLVYVASGDYDFEDWVDTATRLGYSAAFVGLMKLAHKLKCAWLKLDADGPLRDDLPKFEW